MMPLKSSDLSYSTKQQVLSQIRAQMGTDQYDQMINAIGEDGVIDLLLSQAVQRTATSSPPKKNLVQRILNSSLFGLIIFIVGCIISLSYLENQSDAPEELEAERILAEMSSADTKTLEERGLSDLHVFGRAKFLMFTIIIAGPTTINTISDSPAVQEVIIPLWVEGKGNHGELLRQSREFHITLVKSNDDSAWKAQNHEFENIQALSIQRQIVKWLIGVCTAPTIIFFALALSGTFIASEHWPGWVWYIVWIIAGVSTVILVGYISYTCFGSVKAVIIGYIVYIVIAYFLVKWGNYFLEN